MRPLALFALLSQQRVVFLRPPVGSLRRGVFSAPQSLSTGLVLASVALLVLFALYRRFRRR